MNNNPLKAIRQFCLECVGTSLHVQECTSPKCFLFNFRFGKRPIPTKKLSEEQIAKMQSARKVKNN